MEGFFASRLELIIRRAGLVLETPEAIDSDRQGFEVAGMIDCKLRVITIARNYPPEYRRFTTAHELGHWFLHPGRRLHRDRPLQGGEHSNPSRPDDEQEADIFAAELLMPARRLLERFSETFGLPISADDRRLELIHMHSPQHSLSALAEQRRRRSMLIAQIPSLGPKIFLPLYKEFGVSPTAMAIQLEDLDLVT
jgi:Zn-dependent peptidase ImmA (M78 family)